MSRRVPVLRQDDVHEFRRDAMNHLNNGITVGDGKRPAGAEIVLHVGDYKDVLRHDLHRLPSEFLPRLSPALP